MTSQCLWAGIAQQPVGVFVDGALPRAVRVSKEHGDTGHVLKALILTYFLALVMLAQRFR